MSRAFSRGRFVAAAVAAAALAAPAPASAATPCANPEGTVVQGYAGDQYVLVQQAPGSGGGSRVCFQSGGATGADVYRVLHVPASTGEPRFDNNADACRYYGGRTLLPDPAGVGSLVVSERATATHQWVCFEMAAIGFNLRMKLPLTAGGQPGYEEVAVAPARDTSAIDGPSACDGAGSAKPIDLFVRQSVVELTHTAPDPTGRTTACVRAQDAVTGFGFGGTFVTDLDVLTRIETSSDTSRCWVYVTAVEGVWAGARIARDANVCVAAGPAGGAHLLVPVPESEEEQFAFSPHADTPLVRTSDDLSPCTTLVTRMDDPDYLHLERSEPLGDGPTSVCVSTAPGSGTRYEIDFPQDGPVQVSSDVSPCTYSLDRVFGVYPSVDSSVNPEQPDIGTFGDPHSVCVTVWGPPSGVRLQLTVPEVEPESATPDPVPVPAVDAVVARTTPDTTPCTRLVHSSGVYDDTVFVGVKADGSTGEVPGTVCVTTTLTEPVRVQPTLP